MRIGSLFSGYGGLEAAAEAVFDAETAWVSDIDPGACKVLAHRFPTVPNLGDITAIDWATVEPVDIITGGSPCQDLSHAGRRQGMTEGTRSNLWVAMREAIAVLRPQYVIWENVRGAMSAAADSDLEPCAGCMGDGTGEPVLRALGRVLGDLASIGYDAQWHGLRAADVGAPHGRWRVFVLAYTADAAHLGHERRGTTRERRAGSANSPGRALTLLPTTTRDVKGHNQRRDHSCLTGALLPTPSAIVANDGEGLETWQARRERVKAIANNGNGFGVPLSVAVRLLPTPQMADALGGRVSSQPKDQRPSGAKKAIPLGTAVQTWGQYAPAIARWERVIERPSPAPTQVTRTGGQRLSPAFTEWMMGLPAGWITDVPGVTRNEALKLCGNGVVPQQAEAALRLMLARAASVGAVA